MKMVLRESMWMKKGRSTRFNQREVSSQKKLVAKKSLAKLMSVKDASSGKIGELREQNKNERFASFMGI
jgi:hypothetical protein